MASIVIATHKSWNIAQAEALQAQWAGSHQVHIITEKEALTPEALQALAPDWVFFPHWSHIIPEAIWGRWRCVVFHMTDLPFGRGGSPLQNLLVRGVYQTQITALQVTAGLDEGPIFLKHPLDISTGSAAVIFQRASELIFQELIPRLVAEAPEPQPQTGEAVHFRRRKPEESNLAAHLAQEPGATARQVYDFIRMLDAEGYPSAYVELPGGQCLLLHNATWQNGELTGTFTLQSSKTEPS